jgi:hypothetical protein
VGKTGFTMRTTDGNGEVLVVGSVQAELKDAVSLLLWMGTFCAK